MYLSILVPDALLCCRKKTSTAPAAPAPSLPLPHLPHHCTCCSCPITAPTAAAASLQLPHLPHHCPYRTCCITAPAAPAASLHLLHLLPLPQLLQHCTAPTSPTALITMLLPGRHSTVGPPRMAPTRWCQRRPVWFTRERNSSGAFSTCAERRSASSGALPLHRQQR